MPSLSLCLSFLLRKNGAHYTHLIGSCREWLRSSLQSTQHSTGCILSLENISGVQPSSPPSPTPLDGSTSQITITSSAQSLPMVPISLGVKTKDLTEVHKLQQPTTTTTPPSLPSPSLLQLSPSPPQPQLHWLPHFPSDNSGTIPPQGLCTCSPTEPHGSLPTSTDWRQYITTVQSLDSEARLGSNLSTANYQLCDLGQLFHLCFLVCEMGFYKYFLHGIGVEIQRTGICTVVGTSLVCTSFYRRICYTENATFLGRAFPATGSDTATLPTIPVPFSCPFLFSSVLTPSNIKQTVCPPSSPLQRM